MKMNKRGEVATIVFLITMGFAAFATFAGRATQHYADKVNATAQK